MIYKNLVNYTKYPSMRVEFMFLVISINGFSKALNTVLLNECKHYKSFKELASARMKSRFELRAIPKEMHMHMLQRVAENS